MSAPPTLVTVEVVETLWLVWDDARGHWTLRAPTWSQVPVEKRRLECGTWLTLVWPEPR